MLRKKRFYSLLLLIGLLGFIAYAYPQIKRVIDYQKSDEELLAAFSTGAYGEAKLGYAEGGTRRLRYLQIGRDTAKPMLVFVHGSPSSSAFWLNMLRDTELRERANLLAIDRPGYGGSGLGEAMISVQEQARNVAAVIRERLLFPGQAVVLHGSSYGGTVSARLAMDFPRLVDGLLLQSASMAPREEYVYWLSHPTSHWLLKWLIPSPLQTANAEKLNHQEQLEAMVPGWKSIDDPTVILHGTDDWLIYPPNAYFACDKLVNAEEVVHHMVEDGEHDLITRTPQLLKHYLNYLLDRVTTGAEQR